MCVNICLLQCRTYGTVSVEVRKTQHKYIVGPKGQGLHEVLQTTGVWVEVPPSESDVNTITLRGPQEKLGQALTVVSTATRVMSTQYATRVCARFRSISGPSDDLYLLVTRIGIGRRT